MRRGRRPVLVDEGNDRLAVCFTLANLMEAARLCARGVSWKYQVQRFNLDRICQCQRLRDEILTDRWRPRDVAPFLLTERGKVRRVLPVNMRDRVVERCFCEQVLVPMVLADSIEDSSACMVGRGLDYAVRRVRMHLEAAPPGAWRFQFDFHDYFHSIRRRLLLGALAARLPREFVRIAELSIGGADGMGIELGSHVCQLLAVWFPTPLDHLMQSLPGFVGYHRYMDDGIAFFERKSAALNARRVFIQSAEAMGLGMNPHKTLCNRATAPFVFCKTRFTKRRDGVRVNVRKEQTHRTIRHLRSVIRRAENVEIDLGAMYGSCVGYLNRGDADLTHLMTEFVEWPPSLMVGTL